MNPEGERLTQRCRFRQVQARFNESNNILVYYLLPKEKIRLQVEIPAWQQSNFEKLDFQEN